MGLKRLYRLIPEFVGRLPVVAPTTSRSRLGPRSRAGDRLMVLGKARPQKEPVDVANADEGCARGVASGPRHG